MAGMTVDTSKIGNRIRSLRQAKGMTQHELAEALNISTVYVCKLERGSGIPSIDLCLDISQFFGVSVDYILTGGISSPESLVEIISKAVSVLLDLEQRLLCCSSERGTA